MKQSVKNAVKAELQEAIKDPELLKWLNDKIDHEKQINFRNNPSSLNVELTGGIFPVMLKHPEFQKSFPQSILSSFNVWKANNDGKKDGIIEAKNAMQEDIAKKQGKLDDKEKALDDKEKALDERAKQHDEEKQKERGQSMRAIEKAYGPYLEEIAKQRLPDDMLRDALVKLAKEGKIPVSGEKGQQLLERMGNLVRAYETRNLQYNYLAGIMQKDDSMRKYMNPDFMQEYTQGNFDYNPIDYRNQPVPIPYANYSYRPKQKKRWLTKRMYWQVSNMGF